MAYNVLVIVLKKGVDGGDESWEAQPRLHRFLVDLRVTHSRRSSLFKLTVSLIVFDIYKLQKFIAKLLPLPVLGIVLNVHLLQLLYGFILADDVE